MEALEYLPQGYCLAWDLFWNDAPALVWAFVVTNFLIAVAFFSIPTTLFLLRFRSSSSQRVMPFLATLFMVCIWLNGMTQILDILVLYYPWYRVQLVFDLAAAFFSILTAIRLVLEFPRLLALNKFRDLLRLAYEIEIPEMQEVIHRLEAEVEALRLERDFIDPGETFESEQEEPKPEEMPPRE